MTIEQEKTNYDRIFSKHTLEMVLNNDPFRAYMLRHPKGGRLEGVMIMFTPEGIVIAGDHAPGRYGAVSQNGYGLDWFSSRKDENYLAEKFGVEKVWVREYAVRWLQDTIKELREDSLDREAEIADFAELLADVQNEDASADDFYTKLDEFTVDDPYDIAQAYNPDIIGKLAAIQHRFADLMGDMGKDVKELQTVSATPV